MKLATILAKPRDPSKVVEDLATNANMKKYVHESNHYDDIFVELFIIYLSVIRSRSGYATNSQNIRINRSMTSKLAALRGKPNLHYTYEQLLDDKMIRPPFYI